MVSSRFTQPSEARYAPVEGEALAVVYALEKAKFFVLGCDDLTIAVDHRPLLGITLLYFTLTDRLRRLSILKLASLSTTKYIAPHPLCTQ